MGQRPILGALAIVIGLLFVALAFLYWLEPAGSLPAFVPGHEPGVTTPHYKHGLLAFVVGLGCFVTARFLFGPKDQHV